MKTAQANDLVLLISHDHKRYLFTLRAGDRFHTHKGVIEHDEIIGQPLGREMHSHIGQSFMILQPSLYDLLMNLKRASQIIYPKEIGPILLRMNVGCGQRVIEAGTGSGALTMALAHSVRPGGMVYSYETRADMLVVARHNLERVGLQQYVQLIERDIAEGFTEADVDALFLDVREPWDYLGHVCEALADGGSFGALVPTTNQVSWLLAEMERQPFTSIEVMEVFERMYKPVPARLRPNDIMVGHTGFLVFARKVAMMEPAAQEGEASEGGDEPRPISPDEATEDGLSLT